MIKMDEQDESLYELADTIIKWCVIFSYVFIVMFFVAWYDGNANDPTCDKKVYSPFCNPFFEHWEAVGKYHVGDNVHATDYGIAGTIYKVYTQQWGGIYGIVNIYGETDKINGAYLRENRWNHPYEFGFKMGEEQIYHLVPTIETRTVWTIYEYDETARNATPSDDEYIGYILSYDVDANQTDEIAYVSSGSIYYRRNSMEEKQLIQYVTVDGTYGAIDGYENGIVRGEPHDRFERHGDEWHGVGWYE